MLSFKKLVKFALVGGLAFGIVLNSGSVSTFAADNPAVDVTSPTAIVDYDKQEFVLTLKTVAESTDDSKELNNDDPHYVFVSISKNEKMTWNRLDVRVELEPVMVEKDGKKVQKELSVEDEEGNTIKKPAWKRSYVASVSIASFINAKTDYKIYYYTDLQEETDKASVSIAKQSAKIKASYDRKNKTLTVDTGGTTLDPNQYELKTLYGENWISAEDISTEDFDSWAVYGTTLVVRENVDGKPLSKEAKVKIPKAANGPKAVIDPSKITVKIPNNVYWRIVGDVKRTDTTAKGSYIWTKAADDQDGWILNSTKTAQSLQVLQDAVTKVGAQIGEAFVINPKYQSDKDKYSDREVYGQYLKADGKTATDNEKQAGKEPILADIFENGAVLELKTKATDKKAESKVSYYNIPSQNDAVEVGEEGFSVTYTPDTKKEKIDKITFKNNTEGKLEIAVADSATPDLAKTKFTVVAAKATKEYKAKALADGKFLIVRIAAVKATKQNPTIELGGAITAYAVSYPKQAGSFNDYKFAKGKTDGETTLTITKVTEGKKYYYETAKEKIEKIGLCETIAKGATELVVKEVSESDPTLTASAKFSGKAGDLYVIYETDEDGTITAFSCYELKEDDIKPATE